ncbi:unnamed protein product, partial [Brassica oleracea var. botrytis]
NSFDDKYVLTRLNAKKKSVLNDSIASKHHHVEAIGARLLVLCLSVCYKKII